ncbi:hypothetical protein F383_06686 [Gossypium arboreum]|uniref:Uncharacterized protein n=1 Tax=Gossypium arboreum TaxID=29729 RepID=A0A0B0P7C8_GOSAR|nr:hypothetical protein F383_26715 [Gossypium arboreum]KHG25149.1 hypothetical protein F383_06686 [Gossypium arboreum]
MPKSPQNWPFPNRDMPV